MYQGDKLAMSTYSPENSPRAPSPDTYRRHRKTDRSSYIQRLKVLQDRNRNLPKIDFGVKAQIVPKVGPGYVMDYRSFFWNLHDFFLYKTPFCSLFQLTIRLLHRVYIFIGLYRIQHPRNDLSSFKDAWTGTLSICFVLLICRIANCDKYFLVYSFDRTRVVFNTCVSPSEVWKVFVHSK